MPTSEGRIITFYSYKGGTGRSMALANVAWILACNGNRVLVIDWDLEAPGLHRYFSPFLEDKDMVASDGIINFVNAYKLKALTPPPKDQPLPDDWYLPYANIRRYACALNWNFNGGRLDLVPAGRQDASYSSLVNSFNWSELYERLGGANFLEAAKRHMRQDYHYILIDSRTGVSDTSGICTIQMPDDLVICYTLNNQSIRGAAAVATAASSQRKDLRVFPVPMRVDSFEKKKLELRRQFAKERFCDFPSHLDTPLRESYRARTLIPYIPYYAYEEILAGFGDTTPAEAGTMLESVERLIADVFGPNLKASPVREGDRQRILAEFEGSADQELIAKAEKTIEQFSPEEVEAAKRVLLRLILVAPPQDNGEDKSVPFRITGFDDLCRQVVQVLANAEILIFQHEEFRFAKDTLLRSWQRLRGWVDADREFLLWRQGLWKKAADWQGDEKLLLRGTALTEAEKWLLRRKNDLLKVEADYIEASLDHKKRRDRTSTAAALVALVVFGALFSYFNADNQWRREEPASGKSTVGLESLQMTPLVKGRLLTENQSGYQVWDPSNQTSLLSGVGAVDLNLPGDSLIVTDSHLANLIDAATLKQYSLQLGPLDGATFDRSGRYVLTRRGQSSTERSLPFTKSLSAPSEIEIDRAADFTGVGTILESPTSSPLFERPYSAYVIQTGTRIVVSAQGRIGQWEVLVFDTRTGLLLFNLDLRYSDTIYGFDVNEKKSLIAVISAFKGDLGVTLYDLSTGHTLNEALWSDSTLTGASLFSATLRFSTDGSWLAVATKDRIWIRSVPDLSAAPACSPGAAGWIASGPFAVCAKGSSSDASLWKDSSPQPLLAPGLSLATVGLDSNGGHSLYMSGDGSRLLLIRNTGSAELWNPITGTKIADLKTNFKDSAGNDVNQSRVTFASFTLDDSAFSLRLEGGLIMLYALADGARLATLENAGGTQQSVYYDAKCHRANLWTDAGRVLRYTEGKKVLDLFIRASWLSRACQ